MSVSKKELQTFADREGAFVGDVRRYVQRYGKMPTSEQFWGWVSAEEDRAESMAETVNWVRRDPDSGGRYY